MENIQVTVRVRPTNAQEVNSMDLEIWQIVGGDTITVAADRFNDLVRMRKFLPSQRVEFTFNSCYEKTQTTQSIYHQQIRRIILSALQGINGTVFMYGQTGSGKTFTMMGPHGAEAQILHNRSGSNSQQASTTPKNLLKEIPRPQTTQNSNRTNPRNNSHRSPSHRTKDRTPQRQESGGFMQADSDTPDKMGQLIRRNGRDEFKQLQFESENDQKNQEGILQLALNDLFQEIAQQPDKQFLLRCSYIEIYTDQVYDLLKPLEQMGEVLSINEDHTKEFYIKGATEEIVTCIDDVMEMIRRGETSRHYASTIMNHVSSRSHTIFRLYVRSLPNQLDPNQFITESILNFVDLAGSEKINIHDPILKKRNSSIGSNAGSLNNSSVQFKERTTESKHINKSLFYLTQVISLRSQGSKDQHIPYRNSPLTKILRSSLGGNSRTAIILCVNPCFSQFEQTLSTLRFGQNAKQIRNNVQKNIVDCGNEVALRQLIDDYERKIKDMERYHLHKNEDLEKIIEKLQERVNVNVHKEKPHHQFINTQEYLQQILEQNQRPKSWSHVHFPNVGILQVPIYEESGSNTPRSIDMSYQKNQVKKETNLNEQVRLLDSKAQVLQHLLEDSQNSKQELFQQIQKLERKCNQLTKKLAQEQQMNNTQREKSKYLQIITALYHGQLTTDELIFLDSITIDKIFTNIYNIQEMLIKLKMYKNIVSQQADTNSFKLIEQIKIHPNPVMAIKYPKYFLDCNINSQIQYWDQDEDMMTNEDGIQDANFESFQTYFLQQFTASGLNRLPELETINHQLNLLKQDYNILNMNMSGDANSYGSNERHYDVQSSIQSIQNFREPASHQQKVYSTQTYLSVPNPSSPVLKEKHRNQLEELTQIQNVLRGKENSLTALDFSKKHSLPCTQNDEEQNFQRYFEMRKNKYH